MSTNEKDTKIDAPTHLERVGSYDEEDQKYDPTKVAAGMDDELAKWQASSVVITEEESNRLRRMVNKRVLLIMLVTYFFQGLDKGTIGFASIMGIRTDAKLVGQEYAWLTTIFYIAAVVTEYPMNRIVQRFPVAKVLGICVFLWGATLACTAACTDFKSLMIVRYLLGTFETAVQPCFLILTSMWYKRTEQGEVVSYWMSPPLPPCAPSTQLTSYIASATSNGLLLWYEWLAMVGGLMAYGISHYTSPHMKSWQLLFTVLGCITCLWSGFMLWWMPDSPMRAKCWDEETKTKLVERVRENQTGLQNKTYKIEHVKEALADPALWLLFLTQVVNCLCSGGNSAFSNIVISSFGFTYLQTQLLNIAQGAVVIVTCLLPAYLARKYKQTIWIMVAASFPMIAGTVVIMKVKPSKSTRIGLLIAFYTIFTLNAVAVLLYGLLIRNVGGRTKQATAIVMVFLGWAAGNCIGPQVFRAKDAPRYTIGFSVYLACAVTQIVVLTTLRFLYVARNKKKAELRASLRDGDATVRTDNAFDDLTDMQNPDFVYQL